MRPNAIFTIKSQYPQRGCYWVFKTDDTWYRVSYDSKWGWLSKGDQAMFSIDLPEVKVGLKHDDARFFSDWYVNPTVVKTDRLATITYDGKIVQASEPEFPDKSTVNTVNFFDDMNNRIKDT